LRSPWPGSGGTYHYGKGARFTSSLPHLYRLSLFRSIPSFQVLLFGVAIRR
jgi:hypothetical protein